MAAQTVSPWIIYSQDEPADPQPGPAVTRHYFHLDGNTFNHGTVDLEQYEIYAWISVDIDQLTETKKLSNVLLPLTRWTKLRQVFGDDPTKKQSWAQQAGCPIFDGRDVNGGLVEIDFHKSQWGGKPNARYFEDLFITSQNEFNKSRIYFKNSKVWTATKITFPKRNSTTGTVETVDGYGYKLRISPADTWYKVDAQYFRMRNKDLKSLGYPNSPSEAYISTIAVLNFDSAGDPNNKHRLAVRTETGALRWLECASSINLQNKLMWTTWQDNGTRKIDHEGAWARRTNPEITLMIRPLGNSGLDIKPLFLWVKENVVCKQTYLFSDSMSIEEIATKYKHLSVSPFFDYQTLISVEDWSKYMGQYPDREWPLDLATITAANAKLGSGKLTRNTDSRNGFEMANIISLQKIQKAVGTRPQAPTQATVMGGSATDIAEAFGWAGFSDRIKAPPNSMWPGTGNMPAEWLHRSAYSFGGLRGDGNYFSSQVQENLVFGSSECNTMMTRYEKAYQTLFAKEEKFRRENNPTDNTKFLAKLTTRMNNKYIIKNTLTVPFIDHVEPPQYLLGNGNDGKPIWDNIPWLFFSLEYSFELEKPSQVLGGPKFPWKICFFPFQRGFYTILESEVDLQLFDYMVEARKGVIPHPDPMIEEGGVVNPNVPSEMIVEKDPVLPEMMNLENIPESMINQSNESDVKLIADPLSNPGTAMPAQVPGNGSEAGPATADDALWAAVCSGPPEITVDGMTISHPVLLSLNSAGKEVPVPANKIGVDQNGNGIPLSTHQPGGSPSTIPTTPVEFVVQGEVDLYGLRLRNVIFSTVKGQQAPGISHRISLPPLSLGMLIPEFKGTVLDAIALENTVLSYHSYQRGPTRPAGMHVRTDITLSGNDTMQPISDVLSKVFGEEHAALTVSGYLSNNCHWDSPVVPTGFTLSASLMKMEVKLFDVLEITDIGVDFIARRAIKPNEELTYDFDHGYWGGANVTIPGSVVPMRVDWYLTVTEDSYSLMMTMQDDQWKDVMGVKGLNIEDVQFNVSWEKAAAMDSLDIEIQATMKLRSGTVMLKGQYSKDNWLLECELDDVDLIAIEEMYEDVFNVAINQVGSSHDITFKELKFTVSKAGGLVLHGEVTVNGYTSASATISLNTAGLEIKGSVENVVFDDLVTIEKAKLDVYIGVETSNTGRAIRVQISGEVMWEGLPIIVGLFMDKIPGEPLQWTVYGDYEHDIKLSHFSTAFEDTWLDIDITQLAFVASNQSTVSAQVPNKFKYPVKRGVQLFATLIDSLSAVNGVTKTTAGGLTLCVASSGEKLTMEVILPMDKDLSLSKSMTTGTLAFEIVISDKPHIKVTSDITVVVASQPEPLELKLELKAGDTTAEGKGIMITPWKNPFGLSPKLTINDLSLEIKILYETFLETGVPETLEFGGGVAFGTATGEVLIEISEDPTQELISATVTNVDLTSLFSISNQAQMSTSAVTPENNQTLKLTNLVLYLSTGATLNGVNHPAGISFDCKMDIFGHNAEVKATIADQITLYGEIDPFALGPLSVTSLTDNLKGASVDIAIGPTDNHIKLDGAVIICSITAGISVDIELSPNPLMSFIAKIAFAESLEFDMKATMDGSFNGTGSGDLDFSLEVEMHQEILQHIIQQAQAHFTAMFDAAQSSDQAKEKDLDALEAQFTQKLNDEKNYVIQEKALADQKRADVNKAFNDKKASLEQEKSQKEANIAKAKQDLDLEIHNMEVKLDQTKLDVAKKIGDAKVAIETAAREAEKKIEDWKKFVNEKQTYVNVAYGNVEDTMKAAQADLDRAKDNVHLKNDQITGTNMQIDNCGFWDGLSLHWEVVEYEIERDALVAIEWVAQKAVDIGNAVINEAFHIAEIALDDAQKVLSAGEADIAAAAKDLQADLDHIQVDADSAINDAETALEDISKGILKLAFDEATSLLDEFMDGLVAALSDVQGALDTIEQAAEIVAYNLAMDALDEIQKNIKALDPLRLALTLEEEAEKALNAIVQEALTIGGKILDIQEVKFSGSLKALHTGSKPLSGTVVAVLAGTTHTFSCTYKPGGIEEFLKGLWDEVCKVL